MRDSPFDAQVTNYRKHGSTFENLLVLIPVRDSTSDLRFCVGLQYACTAGTIANAPAAGQGQTEEEYIQWASLLLVSFPDTVQVQQSRPRGAVLKAAPDKNKLNAVALLREAVAGVLFPANGNRMCWLGLMPAPLMM